MSLWFISSWAVCDIRKSSMVGSTPGRWLRVGRYRCARGSSRAPEVCHHRGGRRVYSTDEGFGPMKLGVRASDYPGFLPSQARNSEPLRSGNPPARAGGFFMWGRRDGGWFRNQPPRVLLPCPGDTDRVSRLVRRDDRRLLSRVWGKGQPFAATTTAKRRRGPFPGEGMEGALSPVGPFSTAASWWRWPTLGSNSGLPAEGRTSCSKLEMSGSGSGH